MLEYDYNYMIILLRIHVSIPFQNCGLLYEYHQQHAKNEKYFYNHYNEFKYNHDYVKLMKYSYIYKSMYTYLCKSIYLSSSLSLS